jgi:hypothetical protein
MIQILRVLAQILGCGFPSMRIFRWLPDQLYFCSACYYCQLCLMIERHRIIE